MEVNYKNPKYYNTAKLPIRQPLIFTGLMAHRRNVDVFNARVGIDKSVFGRLAAVAGNEQKRRNNK